MLAEATIGNINATANFYLVRRNTTRSHQARNKVYALWQPPIGIFDSDEPMGAGDYRIQLNPNASYRAHFSR